MTWDFQQVDGGTQVTWTFAQHTAYPFGRLGMMIGRGFLLKAFERGLANLKEVLEADPPQVQYLGPITIEVLPPMETLVARGSGSMDEIGQLLGELYGKVFEAVGSQQLTMDGQAFAHYLDVDEATGFSTLQAGVIVQRPGEDLGDLLAVTYPEMKVVQALHTGPYEQFRDSYEKMGAFIAEQGLAITGESFEFYKVGMQDTPDASRWQTLIAFPLK